MNGRVMAFLALWVIMAALSLAALMSDNLAIQKVGYFVGLVVLFVCLLIIDAGNSR